MTRTPQPFHHHDTTSARDIAQQTVARQPFFFELDDETRRTRESSWGEADLCASINRGRNLVLLAGYTASDRDYIAHPTTLSPDERYLGFPGVLADILQAARYGGEDVEDLISRALHCLQAVWDEAVADVEMRLGLVEVGEPLPTEVLAALKARLDVQRNAEDREEDTACTDLVKENE